MKNSNKIYPCLLLLVLLSFGCSNDEPLEESRIDTSTPELNMTDTWIREHLTEPYNIDVDYLFNDNEVATNRYLAPPQLEEVIPFLEAYEELMIEPYVSFAGEEFVKKYFSKLLVLVGSYNFNNDGTRFLGQAEGGVKVTIYELNFFSERTSLELNSPEVAREQIKEYFKTLQHEFSHILQQTKPYDKESYRAITPTYRSSWFNLSVQQARNLGFISPYASLNEDEDFVEMVSIMLTNTPENFQIILNSPNNDQAKQALRDKLDIIVDYYQNTWNINLYELQNNISNQVEDYLNNA